MLLPRKPSRQFPYGLVAKNSFRSPSSIPSRMIRSNGPPQSRMHPKLPPIFVRRCTRDVYAERRWLNREAKICFLKGRWGSLSSHLDTLTTFLRSSFIFFDSNALQRPPLHRLIRAGSRSIRVRYISTRQCELCLSLLCKHGIRIASGSVWPLHPLTMITNKLISPKLTLPQ